VLNWRNATRNQRLLVVITVLNLLLLVFSPADPTFKMPDGTVGYPETVLLRLIDSKGGPNVKLGATERGAGLLLGGKSDPTYVQILAQGPSTSLKLGDKDGRERLIKP
jgi:hypothetical protein